MQFLPVTQKIDQMPAGERNNLKQDTAEQRASFFSIFSSRIEEPLQNQTLDRTSDWRASSRVEDKYRVADDRQSSDPPSKEPENQEPVLDRENFASIKDDLEEAGVSKEKIDEWEQKIEKDGSIPVAEVVNELEEIRSQNTEQIGSNSKDANESFKKQEAKMSELDKLIALLEKFSKSEEGKTGELDKLIALLNKRLNQDSGKKSGLENIVAQLEKIENEDLKKLLQKLGFNDREELLAHLKSELSNELKNSLLNKNNTNAGKNIIKDPQLEDLVQLLKKFGLKEDSLKEIFSKLDNKNNVELSSKQLKNLKDLLEQNFDNSNGSEHNLSGKDKEKIKTLLSRLGINKDKIEKLFSGFNQKLEKNSSIKLSDPGKNFVAESSKESANNNDKTKTSEQNNEKSFLTKEASKSGSNEDKSNSSGQDPEKNNEGGHNQDKKKFVSAESSTQENKNVDSKSTSSSNFSNTLQAEKLSKLNEYLSDSSNTSKGKSSNLSRQDLLRQIENGVFKNLENGKKQLTLKLDPPDLGKLNVILQVKDKEVSAIFKTENQDVHRIMHEQVANLKQSLEQQGLKVNKIEIQSSNQNNNSFQQWLGEEGHNEAREQSQNFSEAGRRQRLRKAKQGAAEDETAQEMLINNNMDKVSSSSLYVVA